MSSLRGRRYMLAIGTSGRFVDRKLLIYETCRAIGLDPEVYPDPEAFKPERWLNDKGEMRDDLKFFNWGFGRRCDRHTMLGPSFCLSHSISFHRICPGMHVADRLVRNVLGRVCFESWLTSPLQIDLHEHGVNALGVRYQ